MGRVPATLNPKILFSRRQYVWQGHVSLFLSYLQVEPSNDTPTKSGCLACIGRKNYNIYTFICLWNLDFVNRFSYPKQSMYGIFTYMYHKHKPNVGKYTLHGWYGYSTGIKLFLKKSWDLAILLKKGCRNIEVTNFKHISPTITCITGLEPLLSIKKTQSFVEWDMFGTPLMVKEIYFRFENPGPSKHWNL